ncbi:hypothetical protein NIES37_73500 (plasmid) [Tolypothrix tenuis PCC 7101]|uniref:Uncharacterized protein n=1 Tax=Tolypothrix tenuis PCC 7101 TaxID=231146 RepID=A0A1Z4NC92_9CYAN|nr:MULTISPECIES: hypothetical protein [unclassified Tolypothrix]MBD2240798.1 hypothetical protein [Aulosira sp. FACHB-113]BAY95928.1 hypothetical protein NIES3275_80050 [Microchaete diplosiphon NIES-3275]BAZ03337.1 hypothetical protein NIES37_73500 [Tolypothrix tenuis PCC 7101]BAZ78692.1 hypothetical protein NIES50_73250 [Aulosira laxa NIES-50]EKE96580.1 hypothetical protein FDUTEX481_06543 [Tolypothrix sp. PCC 7601]
MENEKQYLRTKIDKKLHKEFKKLCTDLEVTMEQVTGELIEKWVQEQQQQQKGKS